MTEPVAEPLVRGVGLCRAYGRGDGEVVAVREATFTVAPNARIALVGPSGSGKSTLLHLVAGLERPDAGVLEWPALPTGPLRPKLVGVAFQGASLLPQLDVTENVGLPLVLGGEEPGAARAAATAVLDLFDLTGVADKLPEEISGGQAQRVAVARAVVGHPRLVLADEPTGQQDSATAAMLLDRLWARADEIGAALLVATHDDAVAARFPVRWSMVDQSLLTKESSR
jgi:putative ABC transport system ATP-binding protein